MASAARIWELIARKLAGEASSEELKELEQLLRAHPELHFPIQALDELWQGELPETDPEQIENSYKKHIRRMQERGMPEAGLPAAAVPEEEDYLLKGSRKSVARRYITWAVAAGVLLVSVTWFFFERPQGDRKAVFSEVATQYGSKTYVQLPDGTSVWLNAGSKLTYNKEFDLEKREVTLTGEGFFDVVRDAERPFIIHTAKMDVKVLGTRFNLKAYLDDRTSEAALIQGSIEVSLKDRPEERIRLKPNEKIVVVHDHSPSSTNLHNNTQPTGGDLEPLVSIRNLTLQDSAILETSWMNDVLVFQDESFRELASKLERWYNVRVRFTDSSIAELRFTGVFRGEPIEQVMRALNITASFQYRFEESTIIISR
ncbi:FecR family protein [Chitinophaga sp. XS-30]|uniref:FecR family protein n=1 Tax=Chitinophaga sp. XS-30 TaxID=2604421 RepID=UPI0011DCDEF5|nr:FecR domain-containing protein [Chitinophaga sp. XS-30]QEH42145.1 FecR family protein [Chitinophaga sp. XS-30]